MKTVSHTIKQFDSKVYSNTITIISVSVYLISAKRMVDLVHRIINVEVIDAIKHNVWHNQ
jgi:hypothetical protein